MRRAAKTDTNQTAIVKALRKMGCSVVSLAAIGKGCPDLLVGWRGKNILLEVKDGNRPPSEQKLTKDQIEFQKSWRGEVFTVNRVERAWLEVLYSLSP